MRNPVPLVLGFLLLISTAAGAVTRGDPNIRVRIDPPRSLDASVPAGSAAPAPSAAHTTFVATYNFDYGTSDCRDEGWTGYDFTSQTHSFWHVADGTELDGGSFGNLLPLEGNQSMWCGAAGPVTGAEDPILCSYAALPGYGNNWDQSLCTRFCLFDNGIFGVPIVYASVRWDTEPGYDATSLEVDHCDDAWVPVAGGIGVWDGVGSDTISIAISEGNDTNFRVRFRFQSDNIWSDQDGLLNTDGAFLVDQLKVWDSYEPPLVSYEDFEDESPGDNDADGWISCNTPGYGDFSGMYRGADLVQEDPCQSELDCVWAFFNGSTVNYACGGWPTQATVPYMNTRGQYIHNAILSPDIAVTGSGAVWELAFSVYRDLPLDPVVAYDWYVRSIDATGCKGGWKTDPPVHTGGQKDWYRAVFPFGQFVEPGAAGLNVALAVQDMCPYWCGILGTGNCHTHAPSFDDVEVYRIASDGPQWVLDDADMFQDNFSGNGTITGTARADMAADILPASSAGILPGDSVCATVSDADNGLGYHIDGNPSSGAAVYFYCHVDGPNAGAAAGDLVVDARYGYVGTSVAGGRTWYEYQMDSTWTRDGVLTENRYNIDLNDNLFVPGDTVWFFFGAKNQPGVWTWSSLALPTPVIGTADINEAAVYADEFTILPAGPGPGADLLYVDGMNFRGAQPFIDDALMFSGYQGQIDRYDIRAPSEAVGNHPGAHVKNAFVQLAGAYSNIVWNTGDLEAPFSDGSGGSGADKSDDTGVLYAWLDGLPFGVGGGLYLSGDDVADVWRNDLTSISAQLLRNVYCNFDVAANDHTAHGLGISPLVVGEPGGMFWSGFGPDTLVAFGGCPAINDFDVLTAEGTASVEMSYHGNGSVAGAIVSNTYTNPSNNDVTVVLSGFSFHEIRDFRAQWPPERRIHMHRILSGLGNYLDIVDPVPTGSPARNELAQNYPNPFNPATTIRYQVQTTGPVTLVVYNVAGQRVRTLIDEVVEAGLVHEAMWRGIDDTGSPVASGVYFYKLVARDFVQTKKMVFLK